MPPIGWVLGQVSFPEHFLTLWGGPYKTLADAKAAGVPTINYGLFINNVLDFLIVAFCIFMVVKQINWLRQTPPPEPTTKTCPQCLSTIPVKAVRCAYCTSEIKS